MRKTFKYMVILTCGLLLTGCIVCSFVAGKAARLPLRCEGLEVVIADSLENSFVTRADVKKYLDREYGTYIGTPLDSLDLTKIEKIIDGRSAVHKSQAYVTRDGILHISVTQRKPIVRFQRPDGGFYADAEGYIFPLQNTYASHVQVIDGNIPLAANSGYKGAIEDPKEKEWFDRVIPLINFMEDSRMWKDKIVQISVAQDGDLTLIPRVGQERFLFGQPVKIDEKFGKMEKYYTSITPEKGLTYYKTVDLRYDGQIVCRK